MSLNNQSSCLSDLGRREEALAVIEEAVTAYRELARTRPDAFLPGLAMSLNNQSSCLSDLGRREEAPAAIEEAVTIRRELARTRPTVFATTEVERPAFGSYGGWGSRLSPVWARNPSMRAGRYWIRLSRFLTTAASWSTSRTARLPRPFFMFDQMLSVGWP